MNSESLTLIKKNSAEPLYKQIKDEINDRISQGYWQPGQKIPSENALVDSLNVSRMTVNRALRELTREGVLNRVHGLGTFISEAPQHASLIQLKDIAQEINARNQQHSSKILVHLKIKASAEIAAKMELDQWAQVFYLEMVHYQDGLPIQLEQRYVNPQLVPEFMAVDFSQQTSTSYLISLFRPDEMEHRVQAVLADRKTADILRIESSQPCLKLSRRTWKSNQVVTFVTMLYPGHLYDLAARYSTNDYQLVKN